MHAYALPSQAEIGGIAVPERFAAFAGALAHGEAERQRRTVAPEDHPATRRNFPRPAL